MFMTFPTVAARWARRGALLAMALFLMPATGLAQSARGGGLAFLGDYRQLYATARAGDDVATNRLMIFLSGLLDGVKAANAAFLASGVEPQICAGSGNLSDPVWLLQSIDLLLRKDPAYFDSQPELDMGTVAVMAVQMRFPCK